ncbi:MAG: DUF2281 domain-containing protein [Candidatus Thorarchaeota archaeon]
MAYDDFPERVKDEQDFIDLLVSMIRRLPPGLQHRVAEFTRELIRTDTPRKTRYLSLDWAGGLRDLREKYTSTDLERMASEWRTEDFS